MALKYVQSNTLYQAGAGNIIGATSIVLTSLTDIYGNVLTMADFGAKGYITCEPDTNNEEAMTFTGITANANGTYTLTGISTVLAKSPYTEASGTVRAHSGGTKVVITDNVAFWNTFGNKNNDEVIAGQWSKTLAPVANNDIPNKAYVDGVAVAGASNANTTTKGIVEMPTQAEVDAKTATGGTGAALAVSPDVLRATKYSDYVADAGATDSYAISTTPATTAYAVGQEFTFKANTLNTGAATLNVNALGAKTIKKNGGANDLDTGDIIANQDVKVVYDGTNMQMVSPVASQKISTTGAEIYAADSVGTDSYAVTLSPAPTAYVTGMLVNFKAGTANTGAATLNVNALGAKTIKKFGGASDLNDGDIIVGQVVELIYDGTNFQMASPLANSLTTTKGTATYDISTASGVQNIAHGLGAIPKIFNVAGTIALVAGFGVAHSFNGSSVSAGAHEIGGGGAGYQAAATFSFLVTAGNSVAAVITADATNIILTWTKTGTPAGTANLAWSASV